MRWRKKAPSCDNVSVLSQEGVYVIFQLQPVLQCAFTR